MFQSSFVFDTASRSSGGSSVASATDTELAATLVALAASVVDEIDSEEDEHELLTDQIRKDLTNKVLNVLRADAARSDGVLGREDLERQCFRRNLTVSECLYIEDQLNHAGVVIGESSIESSAAKESSSDPTAPRQANSRRFLDEAEEREFGRKIQLLLRARGSRETVPPEHLSRLTQEATEAKAAFIETNVRWLRQTASHFARTKHLTEEDLFQEGVLGLLRATELWDPERGFRFKTYAGWWVSQKMHRAIADGDRTIRLPVHVVEAIKRIRKVSRILSLRNGEEPGINLLASTLGMTNERLAELMWTVNATDCLDGDAPIADAGGSDGSATLLSFLHDDRASSAFDISYQEELKRIIKQRLSKRESRVIIMRFGFGPSGEHTLEQIGQKLKLTRERIRQIEEKALEKLKPILVRVVYEKATNHGGVFRTWGG
jgi:RNA polymerase primary sigma factor